MHGARLEFERERHIGQRPERNHVVLPGRLAQHAHERGGRVRVSAGLDARAERGGRLALGEHGVAEAIGAVARPLQRAVPTEQRVHGARIEQWRRAVLRGHVKELRHQLQIGGRLRLVDVAVHGQHGVHARVFKGEHDGDSVVRARVAVNDDGARRRCRRLLARRGSCFGSGLFVPSPRGGRSGHRSGLSLRCGLAARGRLGGALLLRGGGHGAQ